MLNSPLKNSPEQCLGYSALDQTNQQAFLHFYDKAQAWSFLVDKPEETPLTSLIALWHLASAQIFSVRLAPNFAIKNLTADQLKKFEALFEQRAQGTPLSYILGRQHFMGLELISNPDAVIPRIETEMLANLCIELISDLAKENSKPIVIDQFTGSGNLPLCFANRFPNATVYGGDIAEKTLALAKKNAEFCQLAQVEFRNSDMFAAFDNEDFWGKVDLISAAPPYISSKKVPEMHSEISQHEPKLAFDAGPFGIAFIVRLIQESPKFLRSGGWLAIEIGLGQGPSSFKLLEKSGEFYNTRSVCDAEGNVRVIAGQKK